MEKLTIDTDVIRDWAWVNGSNDKRYDNDASILALRKKQFEKLASLKNSKVCELLTTNITLTDFDGKLPEEIHPKEIGAVLMNETPIGSSISVFPMAFPFTFVEEDELTSILNIVFPEAEPSQKKFLNKRKDAMQLLAHKHSGNDYFLTFDKTILRAKAPLQNFQNIQVLSLDQYLDSK